MGSHQRLEALDCFLSQHAGCFTFNDPGVGVFVLGQDHSTELSVPYHTTRLCISLKQEASLIFSKIGAADKVQY